MSFIFVNDSPMNVKKISHFKVFSRGPERKPYKTYIESERGDGHTFFLPNLAQVFENEIGMSTHDISVCWVGLFSFPRVSHLIIDNYSVDEVADMIENRLQVRRGLRPLKVIVTKGSSQSNRSRVTMIDAPQDGFLATTSTNTGVLALDEKPPVSTPRVVNHPDLTKQRVDPRDALYPGTNQSLNDEQAVLYIKTWIGFDTDNVVSAASYSCRPTCVKTILELGATVDRTTKYGMKQNVLELALSSFYGTLKNRKEIVDLAIKHGADLKQKVNYCGSDMTLCEMMDSKIAYLNDYWDGTRCVEPGANDAAIQMYQSLKAYLVECGAK